MPAKSPGNPVPHDSVPPPFPFDLKYRPRDEEDEIIRTLLAATYGDCYDGAEADVLLQLAERCFEQADALIEWPDRELWGLLWEAQQRVDWLQQLFDGMTPVGYKLPAAVAEPAHIGSAERRKELGLDNPDWFPPSYNSRLESSLAHGFTQRDGSGNALRDVRTALSFIQTGLGVSADKTEPRRRPMTEAEVISIRNGREERETIREAIRRERSLNWAEAIEEQLDNWPLDHTYRPFLQGRKLASAPLVALVEALATSWHRAFGKWPPVVRPPSTSAAADRFADILRAFEACYRRRKGELDSSVFETAITRLKDHTPK